MASVFTPFMYVEYKRRAVHEVLIEHMHVSTTYSIPNDSFVANISPCIQSVRLFRVWTTVEYIIKKM